MSGTHSLHKYIDLAIRLRPDLLAQWMVTDDGIGIVELIGPEGTWLLVYLASCFDHCLNELLRRATALTRHQDQFGAKRPHMFTLFLAEGVRGD